MIDAVFTIVILAFFIFALWLYRFPKSEHIEYGFLSTLNSGQDEFTISQLELIRKKWLDKPFSHFEVLLYPLIIFVFVFCVSLVNSFVVLRIGIENSNLWFVVFGTIGSLIWFLLSLLALLQSKTTIKKLKESIQTQSSPTNSNTTSNTSYQDTGNIEVGGTIIKNWGTSAWGFPRKFSGVAKFPKKVYEGDSVNISVELIQKLASLKEDNLESFNTKKTQDGLSISLKITTESSDAEFLELELVAAGFTISGERIQRQSLTTNNLNYRWNCLFKNSGVHSYAIRFKTISPSKTKEVGVIENKLRVVKLDHLTQRQVWILATFSGFISGGLAIAEILRNLGLW